MLKGSLLSRGTKPLTSWTPPQVLAPDNVSHPERGYAHPAHFFAICVQANPQSERPNVAMNVTRRVALTGNPSSATVCAAATSPLAAAPRSLQDVTPLFCRADADIFVPNTVMLEKRLSEGPGPLPADLLEPLQPRRILPTSRPHIMRADSCCCSSSFIHHNARGNRSPGGETRTCHVPLGAESGATQ